MSRFKCFICVLDKEIAIICLFTSYTYIECNFHNLRPFLITVSRRSRPTDRIKESFNTAPVFKAESNSSFTTGSSLILNDALFEDTTVAVLNVEDVKLNENFILNKDSAYSSGGLLGEMILGEDYFNGLYSEPIVSDRKFLQAPVDDFTAL
mgnify:CR=1 FL=1